MDSLKTKILDHEQNIFNEYIQKRNKFIEHINIINVDNLNNTQMKNLIYDIKMVTEPIMSSIENIDNFIENTNNNFDSTESISTIREFQNIVILHSLIS
jgi:hypothetical protein